VVRSKIVIWTLAATIAGIGGGMYVIYTGAALPQSFDTIIGLTWFAVVITNGRRSNNAALAAGLFFVLIPQLFATYLPTAWGPLPTLLFGAGCGAAGPQPGRDHHDERPSARGPGAEAGQRRQAAVG
jgi:branched-chain amino acid transport system permease protein